MTDNSPNKPENLPLIIEDLPENTHMGFNILLPWSWLVAVAGDGVNTAWQWDGFMTYIQLNENVNPMEFEALLPDFVQEKEGKELREGNAGMDFNLSGTYEFSSASVCNTLVGINYDFELSAGSTVVADRSTAPARRRHRAPPTDRHRSC